MRAESFIGRVVLLASRRAPGQSATLSTSGWWSTAAYELTGRRYEVFSSKPPAAEAIYHINSSDWPTGITTNAIGRKAEFGADDSSAEIRRRPGLGISVGKRSFTSVALLVIGVVAFVTGGLIDGQVAFWYTRVLLPLAMVLVALAFPVARIEVLRTLHRGYDVITPNVPDRLAWEFRANLERKGTTTPQAHLFARMLTSPAEFQQRLVESITLTAGRPRQTVTVDLRVPIEAMTSGRRIVVPVGFFSRDELDDFQVASARSDIAVASRLESVRFATLSLRTLLETAFNLGPGDSPPNLVYELEGIALSTMLSDRPSDKWKNGTAEAVYRLLTEAAAARAVSQDLLKLIAATIHGLAQGVLVTARITLDQDGCATYSYTRGLEFDRRYEPGPTRRNQRQWLRLPITNASQFAAPLDNAWKAEHYHLTVDGGDGTYLARQHISDPSLRDGLDLASWVRSRFHARSDLHREPTGIAFVRAYRGNDRRQGHFQVQWFPKPRPLDTEGSPRLVFTFKESPVGFLFGTTLTATGCAILVWLAGFAATQANRITVAPALALILWLYAAYTTWFAARLSSPRHTPRSARQVRLSATLAGIVSVLAAILFVSSSVSPGVFRWSTADSWGAFGLRSLPWVALLIVSLWNASWLWLTYTRRSVEFRQLTRSDGRDLYTYETR
ncbi:hypothetical protein ACIBBG_31830 [Micromonospora chersina]|uniref:hypothetical protein n=1 Tax=Micromonospora chersina TaxID=47854 RepID=UPI00378A7230